MSGDSRLRDLEKAWLLSGTVEDETEFQLERIRRGIVNFTSLSREVIQRILAKGPNLLLSREFITRPLYVEDLECEGEERDLYLLQDVVPTAFRYAETFAALTEEQKRLFKWLAIDNTEIFQCTGENDEELYSPLRPCENLKAITFEFAEHTDDLLSALAHFPCASNLRYIDIQKITNIRWRHFEAISRFQGLTHLKLYGRDKSTLPKNCFEYFQGFRNLRVLVLRSFPTLTNADLAFLEHNEELEELTIRRCPQITQEGLAHIPKKKLRKLELSHCDGIADEELEYLSEFSELQELELVGMIVTDENLAALSQLENLRVLTLTNCEGYTKEGLKKLASLPLLRTLDLCIQLEDSDTDIVDASKNLVAIDPDTLTKEVKIMEKMSARLSDSHEISNGDFQRESCNTGLTVKDLLELKACENLRAVVVMGHEQLSEDDLKFLHQEMPSTDFFGDDYWTNEKGW